MGILSPALPTLGAPRGDEEADVRNALSAIVADYNGNVGTENIRDGSIAEADYGTDSVSERAISSLYPVRCSLTRDATQQPVFAISSWGTVIYNVEIYDPSNLHDLVTNPTRITIPSTGIWLLSARGRMNFSGVQDQTRFIMNGNITNGSANGPFAQAPATDANTLVATHITRRLVAGDYVEHQIFNANTGSAQGVHTTDLPEFVAVKLGSA